MTKTIYVRLLNEGTEVCRPTQGLEVEKGVYEILPTADYDPSDEEWEFPPGTLVRIQRRKAHDGDYFIAIKY